MTDEKSILIIEDDPDTAAAMKMVLEAHSCSVTIAADPSSGFEAAVRHKPKVIILDVMFGKEEQTKGFDYAVKFKQEKDLAGIPILMITAVNIQHPDFHFSPDTDEEFLPVDDFIDKPAQPDDLVQKVERLLSQGVSKWVNWPDMSG